MNKFLTLLFLGLLLVLLRFSTQSSRPANPAITSTAGSYADLPPNAVAAR